MHSCGNFCQGRSVTNGRDVHKTCFEQLGIIYFVANLVEREIITGQIERTSADGMDQYPRLKNQSDSSDSDPRSESSSS